MDRTLQRISENGKPSSYSLPRVRELLQKEIDSHDYCDAIRQFLDGSRDIDTVTLGFGETGIVGESILQELDNENLQVNLIDPVAPLTKYASTKEGITGIVQDVEDTEVYPAADVYIIPHYGLGRYDGDLYELFSTLREAISENGILLVSVFPESVDLDGYTSTLSISDNRVDISRQTVYSREIQDDKSYRFYSHAYRVDHTNSDKVYTFGEAEKVRLHDVSHIQDVATSVGFSRMNVRSDNTSDVENQRVLLVLD